MASQSNLRVRISADLADIKQGMALLRGELAKVKRDGENSAPNTGKWKKALGDIRTQLAGIVTIYGALRAVRWYTDQADQAANLAGRLRLATKSQKEFDTAYRSTYQIAQRSSAEWEAIVGLYASLAQTTGMSQQGVLALTKVISQSFQVSGASAQEASNGLRQIQQALAGGTLRAEEFNTIIETSPRIVQALADHFGISFGQVRQYVNDGKVSSREFAEAVLKASGDIQADFDKLPVTVSRATQQVRNALLAMVGDTDKATGASNDLATGILDLARTLESPDVMEGFRTFVSGVATAIGALVQFTAWVAKTTKDLAEGLAARVHGPAIDDIERIEDRIGRLRTTIKGVEALRDRGVLGIPQFFNSSELVPNDFISRPESVLARLQDELDKENAKLQIGVELRDDAARAQQKVGDTAAAAAPSVDELLEGMSTGGGSGKSKKKSGNQKKVEQLAESTVLARDEIERALKGISQQFEDGALSAADYYAKRTQLQQQAIDLQLQELRSQLSLEESAGRRRDIEERIAILERDRAQVAIDNTREQIKAQDELNRKKAESFGTRLSSITGDLSAREGSISAQMDAGTLGYTEGESRLQEVRQRTLDQLRELRGQQQDYLGTLKEGTPEHTAALRGLMSIETAIADVDASMHKFRQRVEDQGAASLEGFFDDLIDGAKSFKEAFQDMVRSFLAGVAKMIAKELALQAVRAIGRAIGAAHSGGVVGSLRMYRNNIDPEIFAAAPRYHGGGIAGLSGLANDEVATVLRRGEIVRTRQQENALQARLDASRNSGDSLPVRVVVVFGEDELANALSGAAGEKVIVNHVRRNRGAIGNG